MYLGEGCADVSRAPDLYLNEKAREIAPVRMTGNYGGEILRRVRTFKPVDPVLGCFDPEFLTLLIKLGNICRALSGASHFVCRLQAGSMEPLRDLALEESQLSLRSPYLDNDLVELSSAHRSPPWLATRCPCG